MKQNNIKDDVTHGSCIVACTSSFSDKSHNHYASFSSASMNLHCHDLKTIIDHVLRKICSDRRRKQGDSIDTVGQMSHKWQDRGTKMMVAM